MDGRQDSSNYCLVQTDGVLPFAADVLGGGKIGAFSEIMPGSILLI